jgi:hypothetical protein
MRSFKLTPAAAPLAALLVLTPSGALAFGVAVPHHRRPVASRARHHGASAVGGCRVSSTVAPRRLSAGESVKVYGHLACGSGASVGGQQVTVYEREATASSYANVGTTTTEAGGAYAFLSNALSTNTSFYVSAAGVQGPRREAKVATPVEIKEAPADGAALNTTGRTRVNFKGTVNPADVHALVALQREDAATGEQWHRIGTSTVLPGGVFSISHTFAVPGDANVRIVVRAHRINAPSASETFSYEISQAQRPGLTILSSKNPLSYEETVSITGKSAKGANQAVTLFSHLRGANFPAEPVATATTNGNGEYTFPPQKPLVNTFYRVSSDGINSAVMYEGVKYVLDASLLSSTVAAGQPLTFTGSVTPGGEGQPVYLQRENALGGWYVVETGKVGANSAFTITHTPYDVGNAPKSETFRIKVPGNPQNQAKASQPFTVTVNPALASALTPEPANNSTPPNEGQT